LTIVGLPDTAVNEAQERVRAAIRNSGLHFPMGRITVNLAPADLRKEGPSYDLPMAVALLAASEQIALDPARHLFLGELGLDGALRHTIGILPMVALARERAIPTVYVPAVNALEAALIRDVEVILLQTLAELVAHLRGEVASAPAPSAFVGWLAHLAVMQALRMQSRVVPVPAAAQVSGPIASTYWWQGQIEHAEELVCTAKTRQNLYGPLEQAIRELHPYETPAIVATPSVAGSQSYLEWIAAETSALTS
jgi:uncharacterized protein involved in tolerance to divalent cations